MNFRENFLEDDSFSSKLSRKRSFANFRDHLQIFCLIFPFRENEKRICVQTLCGIALCKKFKYWSVHSAWDDTDGDDGEEEERESEEAIN